MPSLESIAGLHAAIDYLSTVGYKRIRRQERALTQPTLDGLASLDHVRLHGISTAVGRGPIFAITVSDRSPKQVARELAQYGVFVSSGHNYAIECVRALDISESEGGRPIRLCLLPLHSRRRPGHRGPGSADGLTVSTESATEQSQHDNEEQ